jgi:hypothetical protein
MINTRGGVMAINSDPAAARHVFYRGPGVVVTDRYIENRNGRYAIRDLQGIHRVLAFTHPARAVAVFCGAIELALAVPVALTQASVASRSAAILCVGLVTAFGVAAAIIVDGRRNPRWMALRAELGGREITLFTSRNRPEFEAVRRAVIRAVEANRPLRP